MSIMFFSEKERIKSLSHAHNTFLIPLLFVNPFIFYALLHLKKSIKTVERKMRLFFQMLMKTSGGMIWTSYRKRIQGFLLLLSAMDNHKFIQLRNFSCLFTWMFSCLESLSKSRSVIFKCRKSEENLLLPLLSRREMEEACNLFISSPTAEMAESFEMEFGLEIILI